MTIVQRGVCIAFDDATLEPDPDWTSLYGYHDSGLRIQQWHIDRGRDDEISKAKTGTLTVTGRDFAGILDATNAFGPFAGKLDPLKQIAIFLTNPETGAEATLYRGFIEDIEYEWDHSMTYADFEITAVDALDILANAEVIPDNAGDLVPTESLGDVFYEDTGDVQTRILAALADAGWPSALSTIFTGNVQVREKVYSSGDSILSVVLDASDSEFPGVAVLYVSKTGIVTFHGRLARFNPTDPTYNLNSWKAGDGAAMDADPTHIVQIASLKYGRGKGYVYNAVYAAPVGIRNKDRSAQLVTDAGSITAYGVRSLSFPDLLTKRGNEAGLPAANAETVRIATYYKDNYAFPRTRVKELSFKTQRLASPNRVAWWAFVCGVDISDVILLTTTHPGGGGFNDNLFVDGVEITGTPMQDAEPQLEMLIKTTPAAYYTTDPFA